MNILVLNGSPKCENSNTMNLTRAFLDGAGWSDGEILDVSKANVKACRGCFACWNKTPGKCVINDQMDEILPKLVGADLIIWSFPLYYFSVPGNLKNVIDRQLPLNLPFMFGEMESGGHPARYDLTQQQHIVLSTCGFWTAQGNYDAVTAMFDHFFGEGNYAKIFCGQGELFRVPELKNRTDAYLELVRCAGAEYAAGGIREETKAALAESLYPRSVFEKMADASWGISAASEEPSDNSLSFTIQMAALYKPDGVERVLEFDYTDVGKTYQILLTKHGSEVISENFGPYTTKIETPLSVWRSIARGDIAGPKALYEQKYKVFGDFELMLKWDALFGGGSVQEKTVDEKPRRKTNMAVLLAPWIAIWVAMAINATAGGIAGILVVAILPLFWLIFQPVVFEQISAPFVAGLSLLVLLGVDTGIVLPVSYGAFGLMWLAGAFTKTPLTAYYSAARYGGAKAFANQLFMHTNKLLTAAWGILYLLISIWTYLLMARDLSFYSGLLTSLCPAFMGLFTLWFQKWYPARWARGKN